MAAVAKNGTPSLATALPPQNEQIPGLRAFEALGAGDLCTIGTDGLVRRSVTTNRVHGVAAVQASAGEAVTLYRNVRFGYGTGRTPGGLVRLSATVPGGLDDAGTEQLVGFFVDAERVQFFGL